MPCPVADRQVDRQQLGAERERTRPTHLRAGVATPALHLLQYLVGRGSLPGVEHRLEQRAAVLELTVETTARDPEGLGQHLHTHGVGPAALGQRAQPGLDPGGSWGSGRRRHRPYGISGGIDIALDNA